MRKLIRYIKNIVKLGGYTSKALRVLKNAEDYNIIMTGLSDLIREKNLDKGMEYKGFQTYYGVGSALQMAEYYNTELGRGTCFSDCRAFIKREHWKYLLNEDIPSTDYGTWMVISPNEVGQIYGYGKTVPEAILRCLLNARVAQVI